MIFPNKKSFKLSSFFEQYMKEIQRGFESIDLVGLETIVAILNDAIVNVSPAGHKITIAPCHAKPQHTHQARGGTHDTTNQTHHRHRSRHRRRDGDLLRGSRARH